MIHVQRFDHIAIAVRDLARAAELYGDALGGTIVRGGDDLEVGIRTMQFKLPPGVKVELLSPIGNSYLARYIDKHGEGFHHATIFVDDIAVAAAEMRERGFEIVDYDDKMPIWQEAFVRPTSGFGALLQLVSSTSEWGQPIDGLTRESVLAGEWRWVNNTCVPTQKVESDGIVSVRPEKNFMKRR